MANEKISLAVKYRPKTFEEVSGQNYTIDILKTQINEKTFKNGYLFCGASGCGKTTIARIMANKINKGIGIPIELDAASNNGVDSIKSIIKEAEYKSLDSEYKVFIIDECHSITSQGWQALLKTLEEPPRFTVFIFCTTEPQKVPETIQNRLQRFDFLRMPNDLIVKRLNEILSYENKVNCVGGDVIEYIAKVSRGGMRDAITNLDKCLGYISNENNFITLKQVVAVLNSYDYESYISLLQNINDIKKVLDIINDIWLDGKDLTTYLSNLQLFITELIKIHIIGYDKTDLPQIYKDECIKIININYNVIVELLKMLSDLLYKIKYETYNKPMVESFFIQLIMGNNENENNRATK